MQQLINKSSLFVLDNMLKAEGYDTNMIRSSFEYWADFGGIVDEWIEQAAEGIAYGAICSSAVFEFEAIVIGGAIPESVKEKIISSVRKKVKSADLRGLTPFNIVTSSLGKDAQSIGSANLPLLALFSKEIQSVK